VVAERIWKGDMKAVLEDYRTAPIDEKLRSTLAFLEKLTLRPNELELADIEAMRTAGVSEQAIVEAMYVSTMFNVMDRLADAFDFELTKPEYEGNLAFVLTRVGYGAASVPR
jgi:alkylhydroperoxidase family enzyme